MAENEEKLKLEISDLDGDDAQEIAVGRAYTIAMAHIPEQAETIKSEALEGDYSHAKDVLGNYFELV